MKDRTVWDRIVEAMKDRYPDHKQADIGRLAGGVTQPSVAEWKAGGAPSLNNGIELCKALGISVEWLYTERGPKHPPPQDEVADTLWRTWQRLSDTERAIVLERALTLSESHPTSSDNPSAA